MEHGCETWFLTSREKYTLSVFESEVLKSIRGTKVVELKAEKRKLYTDEFHDLRSSPNNYSGDKIKNNEIGGSCGTHGEEERYIQGLVEKPE